ncbi:S-layer homology domain-containing protein [Paenibacillaceae bacterium WGS1546]|uniref:S-layer homology domain-containing protein n=1 Tax=Cohnella sp. WGS1546 TaxID=3366810 RepID=UPI00372D084C
MRFPKHVSFLGILVVILSVTATYVYAAQTKTEIKQPQTSSNNADEKLTEEKKKAEEGGPEPDPVVKEADRSDQSVSAWAAADVDWMVSNKVVPPRLQYNYKQLITREEFAALAVSVLDFMSESRVNLVYPILESQFKDTESLDVQQAYSFGIVNGVSDTEFKPEQNISRQEAAMMMANLLQSIQAKNLSTAEFDYLDKSSIAGWARDAVNIVSNLKLFQGTGQGFSPQGHYTREQAIAVMKRLLEYEGAARMISLRGRVVMHLDDLGTVESAKANQARPIVALIGKSSVKFTWTEATTETSAILDKFKEEEGHDHPGAVQFKAETIKALESGTAPVKDGEYTLQAGTSSKPGEGYLLKITW